MYIEQIIIECFKSYHGPIVIGPFDKKYNVIVGRNGSGKSNFFEAIQFVLCDEYHKLSPDEYKDFIHQSHSSNPRSAFVEIIFDNSDGRFPVDTDKVSIRRTIGPGKDQYFLNKEKISKDEILNFFESAGLSKSNPYYIVKQRKLLEIMSATDYERLKHLEEIAGVTLFESRFKEMNKLLEPIVNDLARDDELFANVNKVLKQKENEHQDMKKYVELDKQRQLLELLLNEQQSKKFSNLLTKAQQRHSEQRTGLIDSQKKLKSIEEKIAESVNKVEEIKKEIKNAKLQVRELITEKEKLLMNERNWNVNVDYLTETIKKDKETQEKVKGKLKNLTESIGKYKADLIPIQTKFEAKNAREEEIEHDLAVKKQLQKELNLKKQRKRDFKKKDERNNWIKAQLELLDKDINDKNTYRVKCEKELEEEKSNKRNLENIVIKLKQDLEKQLASIKDFQRELNDRECCKIQFQKQRKDLFESKIINDNHLKHLYNELKKADQAFGMKKSILDGRDSVAKVLDILRQQQSDEDEVENNYFGMVIENFSADDNLNTAIEITAGTRLLNHIVATDEFGMKILDNMNKNELPGEITFLPINRLPDRRDQNYPKSNQALSLLFQLNYKPELDCVMNHIFGKTLLCRDLIVASEAAEQYNFNCVTLGGEQVSNRGDIAGGYRRNYKSPIESQKTRFKILKEIKKTEGDLKRINEELSDVEKEATKNLRAISKLEVKLQKGSGIQRDLKDEINKLEERLRQVENRCLVKEKTLNEFVTSLEIRHTTKEGLQHELEQDLLNQLTKKDQQKLEQVDDEIEKLCEEKRKLVEELIHLSNEKHRLEKSLKTDLLRKEKLEDRLQELTAAIEKHKDELRSAEGELGDIKKKIENIDGRINCDKVTKLLESKVKYDAEIVKKVENKNEILKNYQALVNVLDGLELKMKGYEEKIAEYRKKMNKYGPIKRDDYSNFSCKQLSEKLREVNVKLRIFGNINRDIQSQFEMIIGRKEELMTTKEKLVEYLNEACDLLNLVEERKAEIIQFTFQQMNEYFNQIFKKFVPNGSANLIMRIADQNEAEAQDLEAITAELIGSESFTGVGIKVSFGEKLGEHQTLDQLSSGQKSLVALAFIFAAQKCNPTPFYILDESDYALDPEHRQSLARLIKSISTGTQFITTTFKPEQLEYADKFFGVQIRDGVSYLQKISQVNAAAFIEN